MSEILLFDIFEPQNSDGVSTSEVYPSCIRWVIVLPQRKFEKWTQKKESPAIEDYRYHELGPLISYFPCHWVVPVDFPNTCPMKIERILYRIIARYGRDIYTLTQSYYSLKNVTLRKLPCEKKYVFFIFITQ